MKINNNFLVKDGNNYYFWLRIPKDLVSKLRYREIKKFLHTGDLQKANIQTPISNLQEACRRYAGSLQGIRKPLTSVLGIETDITRTEFAMF